MLLYEMCLKIFVGGDIILIVPDNFRSDFPVDPSGKSVLRYAGTVTSAWEQDKSGPLVLSFSSISSLLSCLSPSQTLILTEEENV